MHDFEMTQPPQPAAAARPDTEPDRPDRPDSNAERTPASARNQGRGSRAGLSREGLPASYRMRHAAHYVEQLMGDTPLQTVRQIALEQIDHPEPVDALSGSLDAADAVRSGVADLAASIRRVGLLQPLLVVQMPGARFQLLAGGKRWLAAQAAGLTTIPCLVVNADAARAAELRLQAAVRAVAAPGAAASESVGAAAHVVRKAESTEIEVSPDTMQHTEAAMTQAAAPDPESVTLSALYGAVMADLARVEQRRAATVSVARAFLADTAKLQPVPIEWAELTGDIRRDLEIEARLRGVQLEWPTPSDLRSTRADRQALLTGCSAILHAVLGSVAAGDRVAIAIATPRIRPAIVFSVAVSPLSATTTAGAAAALRLFAGPDGALMLESVRHSARRQGGRFTIVRRDQEIILEFVVPQFFSGWQ